MGEGKGEETPPLPCLLVPLSFRTGRHRKRKKRKERKRGHQGGSALLTSTSCPAAITREDRKKGKGRTSGTASDWTRWKQVIGNRELITGDSVHRDQTKGEKKKEMETFHTAS